MGYARINIVDAGVEVDFNGSVSVMPFLTSYATVSGSNLILKTGATTIFTIPLTERITLNQTLYTDDDLIVGVLNQFMFLYQFPGGGGGSSGTAGGDLAGTYPDPTVFQATLTDQAVPTPPSSGTLILHSFDQNGFSVPHVYDAQGNAIELTRDCITVARNNSGSSIAKGKVVHVTGSTGSVPTINLAKANSMTTLPVVGIMYETTADNAFGRIMIIGNLENINLSAFNTGDLLYVSATTAGELTNVKPLAPNYAQSIGIVLNNGVGNGVLQVFIRVLDGLKPNVAITGATKTKITYDANGLVTTGADATTADIADSLNKRYVTDAQLVVIGNTSGTNTGDQTNISGNAATATALQTGRTIDGQTFDGTANITVIAPGTHAASSKATPVDADEIPLSDSAASYVLKKLTWSNIKSTLKTYFDTIYQATGSYLTSSNISDTAYGASWNGDTTNAPSKNAVYDELELKQDALTAGYGITGIPTPAVSLSTASAYITAETTISAATYADLTGASVSLAGGTWVILASIYAKSNANAIINVSGAILDGSGAVVTEGQASTGAMGTGNVGYVCIALHAIVSPAGTTTYKLSAARNSPANNAIADDGNAVNANSDKGTHIMAFRIG